MDQLANKLAVVTGSASGIGEGIAAAAADTGMHVIIADIALDRAEAVATRLLMRGLRASACEVDVADVSSIEAMAKTVTDRWGTPSLLVNNAGIEMLGRIWDIPAADWERIFAINVLGVVHCTRAFAPGMIAAAKPAWIANVASVGALGMMPLQTAYTATKHAVLSFTEGLALEMEMTGKPIGVSAVIPGAIATRIFDTDSQDEGDAARHRKLMQSLACTGMDRFEAGRRILKGILAGDFWISTHPARTDALAASRAAYLRNPQRPKLSQFSDAVRDSLPISTGDRPARS